jgi:magnesium-transporting ATPase (P-type)
MRLLAQFHNLLIYVLLGAALIAGAMGHWVETSVILGVVLAMIGLTAWAGRGACAMNQCRVAVIAL